MAMQIDCGIANPLAGETGPDTNQAVNPDKTNQPALEPTPSIEPAAAPSAGDNMRREVMNELAQGESLKEFAERLMEFGSHGSQELDLGAVQAMHDLEPGRKDGVSGTEMMYAIIKATQDHDGNAAGGEYAAVRNYVEEHWNELSPEAKEVFKLYEETAREFRGNEKTGIPQSRWDEMVQCMREASGEQVLAINDPSITYEPGPVAADYLKYQPESRFDIRQPVDEFTQQLLDKYMQYSKMLLDRAQGLSGPLQNEEDLMQAHANLEKELLERQILIPKKLEEEQQLVQAPEQKRGKAAEVDELIAPAPAVAFKPEVKAEPLA